MNTETAKILCKINNEFYRNQCDSFSETRRAPWPGWKRCLDLMRDERGSAWQDMSVFDLACGNLRFEEFLARELPKSQITTYAVDNCDLLVPAFPAVHFQRVDIVEALIAGRDKADLFDVPLCDLSVTFGFMHHVPQQSYRQQILSCLIQQTASGGYVVVSFWQFLNNADMALKAKATHEKGLARWDLSGLDEHDYLLGWKNIPDQYRYCHSFSETEIDQLIESVSDVADLVARFVSDGRTENLNTYVILRVR